ncbi:MAG: hypothetical protein ACJA2Y_000357 [Cycloclasticus pugetii]|jgi:hypothetical protein
MPTLASFYNPCHQRGAMTINEAAIGQENNLFQGITRHYKIRTGYRQ